jgi:hypothetical protein
MITSADLDKAAALAGVTMLPWQRALLETLALPGDERNFRMWQAGKRSGKSTAMRLALLAQLFADGHAHVLARDGNWCVTAASHAQLRTFGPLWERVSDRRSCSRCTSP